MDSRACKEVVMNFESIVDKAIRYNLKAIVVSLPHRVDETVKNNPDLQGRIMNIMMKPWKEDIIKGTTRGGLYYRYNLQAQSFLL